MTTPTRLFRRRLIIIAGLAAASLLHAQTRTWVSGLGDDANPCSRTAPCKTFAGAISKTAAGGEISVLDPAGYGSVTITKAITINGGGMLGGITAPGFTGIVVNAGVNDVVVLRGLYINGVGSGTTGVNFIGGRELHIERCEIQSFTTGINASTNITSLLIVNDSNIHTSTAAGVGVNLASTDTVKGMFATFENVRITGIPTGISAGDRTHVSLSRTVITGGSTVGLLASPAGNGADVTLDESTVSNGGTGLRTTAGGNIRLSHAVITGNTLGLDYSAGGAILSFSDNRINGNAGGEIPSGSAPLH